MPKLAQLLDLSDDVLLTIVEEAVDSGVPYLRSQKRLKVALVCHRFAALVRRSPRFWAVAQVPVARCAQRLASGGRAAGQSYINDLRRKSQCVRCLHLNYDDVYSSGSASSLRGLLTQLVAAVPLLEELWLESIPETAWFDRLLLACPTTLAELALTSCSLAYLPAAVSGLSNLTCLHFNLQSGAGLSVSASSLTVLGQLANLQCLRLFRITQLPYQVVALGKLTLLQLSNSNLAIAGEAAQLHELGGLGSLKELSFLGCDMQAVPTSLSCLVSLTRLTIYGCQLLDLPTSYKSLLSLTSLPGLAEFWMQLFDGRQGRNIASLSQLTRLADWNRRP